MLVGVCICVGNLCLSAYIVAFIFFRGYLHFGACVLVSACWCVHVGMYMLNA